MTEIPILNDDFELVKAKQKITLRHLLTHSSGFGNKNSHPKMVEWEKIKDNYDWKYLYPFPRMFESGTSYLYGISTSWLGILIERLTKMSLADYMKENLFIPMEMNNTFFEYDMTDKQTEMLVSSSQRNLKTRKLEKKEPRNDLFNDWDYFKNIVPDYKYSGQGSINSTINLQKELEQKFVFPTLPTRGLKTHPQCKTLSDLRPSGACLQNLFGAVSVADPPGSGPQSIQEASLTTPKACRRCFLPDGKLLFSFLSLHSIMMDVLLFSSRSTGSFHSDEKNGLSSHTCKSEGVGYRH